MKSIARISRKSLKVQFKTPKIIHQMGPKNRSDWDPIWSKCQKTWKQMYPDYKHMY